MTFDGLSGGGTVTVAATINATNTISTLTMGAFTGTLDFSANNPNISLATLSATGTGVRTLNLGNGTWTITGTGTIWNFTTTTSLTFNANSSTINFTAVSATSRSFVGGGLTYNVFSIAANSSGGVVTITGANTFANFNVTGQNSVTLTQGTTTVITNAFTWVGGSTAAIGLTSSSASNLATVSIASGAATMSWAGLRDMTFTGGATFTATSSLDLGHNTGITITAPTGGGGMLFVPDMAGM